MRFDHTVPLRVQKNIESYTQKNQAKMPEITPETARIAGTDLNEDGINEFIVTTQNCQSQKKSSKKITCPYLIMADKGRSVILLGSIKARSISLANSYSHGVKDIRAYDNELNHFDYNLYTWEPSRSHYTMIDEGQ